MYSGIFSSPPTNPQDVYGSLSLIIWSLTIIPLIKYVCIVIWADYDGEGGTFSLYSLLIRHSGLSTHVNRKSGDSSVSIYGTLSIEGPERPNFISKSKAAQTCLLVLVFFGSSTVISDGLLTPAVSVISAIEGMAVSAPSLRNAIVPISCIIIIILFMGQQFGTNKVGSLFAPIISLWFLSIAAIGIWNINQHPEIFKALNPYYAFDYFVRKGFLGFLDLGGILLAITGVEAMFADLGHFNRKAIQISFPFFVYIPLILAYLGQGASLILNPNVIENTFWLSIPDNKLIYSMMFILATLSTIIASQAMISATFSLVYHSRKLGCFPGVKVVHTSKSIEGQIYLPEVNYFLMTIVLIICITFQKSKNLTNAYGMAVALVMFITTILMTIVIRVVWKFPIFVSIMFFLFFGFIDISFLSATLRKIPNGGWFPLLFATILTFIMCLWRFKWFKNVGSGFFSNTYPDDILQESVRLHKSSSKIFKSGTRDIDLNNERIDQAESSNNTRATIILNEVVLHKTITDLQRKNIQICLSNTKIPLSHYSNTNLFYYDDKKLDTSILVFSRMIKLSPSSIFISIRPEPISCVDYDDLLMGKEVGNYKGCCRIISRYGYMDKIAQCKEFPLKIIQI